jgi:hypothetical protein
MHCRIPGLGQLPSIFKFFRKKWICLIPAVGSQYRAIRVAETVENLIAQINSQGNILRQDAKIEKINTKAKF